jgi:hypothetical protein
MASAPVLESLPGHVRILADPQPVAFDRGRLKVPAFAS